MQRRLALALSASILAVGFAARPVAAQTADQTAGATQVGELVVTAEKRPENIQNVPMSITAVPGAQLDKLQATDLQSYAALVPGLSLFQEVPGLATITLRGLNAGGDGSTVAVYIDESPFGSSNALLNGSIVTGDIDTWDLARIEVLRGPQGTLYGANSEGGLIKFVTNPPVLGAYQGAVEAEGASVDHGQDAGAVRGMVNLPFGADFAIRADATYQSLPGYIDDPLLGAKDINQGYKDGFRVSALFQPTSDFSIRLTALGQKVQTDGSPDEDVNPTTFQPVFGDLVQEEYIRERYKSVYGNYSATIDWNLHFATLTSSTSYGTLSSYQFIDDTSALLAPPATTLGDLLSSVFGGDIGGSASNDAFLKKWTQEIRLASPPDQTIAWLIGGYYTHEDGDLVQALNAFDIPSQAPTPGVPALEVVSLASIYQEYAAFANLTWNISPHFDIEAGGRFSHNQQSASESIAGLLVGGTTTNVGGSTGNVFTYSVAPEWKVNPDTTIYARVATGYRPGGPNVVPPGSPAGVPREYSADNTLDVEGGVRTTQLDGRLGIDVDAFWIDWNKIQLIEVVENLGVDGNGGTARSDGFEGKIDVVPIRGLTLTLDGAYTDAVLTSAAPAVGGADGAWLPYVPRWSGALDGEYDFPVGASFTAFLGATWSYMGERYDDFSTLVPQTKLPAFDTVAVRIGVERQGWRFEVYANNLGDSRGITAFAIDSGPGLSALESIIQPRTVGAVISAKF